MKSKFLEDELKLCPQIEPGRIIRDIARRFNFREISPEEIERIEKSGILRARIKNLCSGIDAGAALKEDSNFQGYPASLIEYMGPVVGFVDGTRKIVYGQLSAHVIQGICGAGFQRRLVRKIERHGYTPEWWPFEDDE